MDQSILGPIHELMKVLCNICYYLVFFSITIILGACPFDADDDDADMGMIVESCDDREGGFIDPRDGQRYGMIVIKGLVWMTENLNYKTDKGSWCYYDDETNCDVMGRLYNYAIALEACPSGCRLPTFQEFKDLVEHLGGEATAGIQLKKHTNNPDYKYGHWSEATNTVCFGAIPSGRRVTDANKNIHWFTISATFWYTGYPDFYFPVDGSPALVWAFFLSVYEPEATYMFSSPGGMAASCRCVKA